MLLSLELDVEDLPHKEELIEDYLEEIWLGVTGTCLSKCGVVVKSHSLRAKINMKFYTQPPAAR